MKRRKNGVKQDTNLYERDVNENILNIITPSGIDFDRSHINVSENVGTIFCLKPQNRSQKNKVYQMQLKILESWLIRSS